MMERERKRMRKYAFVVCEAILILSIPLVASCVHALALSQLQGRAVNAPPAQRRAIAPRDVVPETIPEHVLSVQKTTDILGIAGDPSIHYHGIGWVRLSTPSCGWGNLRGNILKQ